MDFITSIWSFIVAHWQTVALIALITQNVLKGIQDAVDTTPGNDVNLLEKILTVSIKVLGYVLGFRPQAPK